MKTDLAIVGGGCAALWLYHLASQMGRDVRLIHPRRGFGGYATTNGQNRAHTGVMYVLANKDDEAVSRMIAECSINRRIVARP